jgi:hypothetical protein
LKHIINVIKHMSKTKSLALILGTLVIAFLAGRLVLAWVWVEPGSTPPGGNVDAPINVSINSQIKVGPLQVNGFRNVGNTIFDGTVGIGDTTPVSLFTVGSGDLFQVNSSGNIVKINNQTMSWPANQGTSGQCLTTSGVPNGTLSWGACGGGGGAPTDATYITQTANATLTAEQALSFLSTGIMKVTTGTGVITSLTGTTNYFPKWADSGTLSGTSNIYEIGTNIGIGSTSPDAKLDVLSTSTQLRLTYTDNSVYASLGVDSSGNLTITPSGARLSLASSKGLVLGSNTLDLTGTNGMMYYNSNNNKFRCYQNGAWADCVGYWAASGTDIYNTNTGNVGIGMASPASKLEVSGNVAVIGGNQLTIYSLGNLASTNYEGLFFKSSATSQRITSGWSGTGVARPIVFDFNGTEKMRITSDGNVGIGTTGLTEKLEVAGNIKMTGTDFLLDNSGRRGGAGGAYRRALVHDVGDTLVINYAGDYTGGTRIDGNLTVGGNAIIKPGTRITLPGTFFETCSDPVETVAHVITVPSGKTLTVWAMGKTRSSGGSSVVPRVTRASGGFISTSEDYYEPVDFTVSAGDTATFSSSCSAASGIHRGAYWVISIQ